MTTPFKDHFSARAADYARYRPGYPSALADYLAGLAPGRRLAWDCGCGTGQSSGLLAGRFARVVATDASAQQIANAEPYPGVEYRVAPAEMSGLAAGSVDLVTVAQAAHWFELEAFYAEVRRGLAPRGVIALITYGAGEVDGAAGRVLPRFYHEVLDGFWPPERALVESGYRTLPFPFAEETATPSLAMRAAWSLEQLLGYVDTWSAVRAAEAALGRAPYEAFAAELGAAWGDPAQRREVHWPLSLRVGRV